MSEYLELDASEKTGEFLTTHDIPELIQDHDNQSTD